MTGQGRPSDFILPNKRDQGRIFKYEHEKGKRIGV